MNNLVTSTLTDNITTSIKKTSDTYNCIQSITNRCSNIYYNYNPFEVPYNSITTSTFWTSAGTKLETDSNELKINIKKFQIKFNFNL